MEHSSDSLSNVNGTKDKLSELPSTIYDCILSRMPICDAGRTCILSRSWRDRWNTITKLEFDKSFFEDIARRNKKAFQVISQVLLLHRGPILDFSMQIPPVLPLDLKTAFFPLLGNLSERGIKRLQLENFSPVIIWLTSSIFMCKTLTHLSLTNKWILKPLHNLIGLENLVELHLINLVTDICTEEALDDMKVWEEKKDMKLGKLKIVEIVNFLGTDDELLLVKLLFACSPSLEKMHLGISSEIDIGKRGLVCNQVSSLPRASNKAQVILHTSSVPPDVANISIVFVPPEVANS